MSGHIIRVIDFENTDFEPPAQVIEVGYCDVVQTDAGWRVGRPVSWLCGTDKPISPGARSAHHIRASEVDGLAPYDAAAMWAQAVADGVSVVAAHNSEHEAKFWGEPALPVICTFKSAMRVWANAPSFSNGALRYWLEDQGYTSPDHEMTMPPHRAGPDAYVTACTLAALLVEVTAREMAAWTKEPCAWPTCPIGEWRGKPWAEVDAGFLRWMISKPVEPDLVWNARRELDRRSAGQ